MNTTSCEGIKIRIIADTGESDQNSKSTKYLLVVNQLLTYDTFIEQLKRLEIIDLATQYLIFLKDQNEAKLALDKDSFDKLKERVLARTSEDDVYLLLQQESKKSLNTSQQTLNAETNKALEDYWTSKVKPFLDPLIASMLYEKPENSVIIIILI